jgi:hypothetical protein
MFPSLFDADARMVAAECSIQEMSIEFEIYVRFQVRHQQNESLAAPKL